MVLLDAFRRRVGAGNNNGREAGPHAQGNPGGQEAGREVARARNGRQPWEDNVIVRAIRRMRIVGLRQALQPNISLPKRLFWVGVFFVCIWFTIHMLWLAVNEYKMNPTSNTIHDDVPINRGPFPGVTVAATSTMKTSGIENAMYFDENRKNPEMKSWTKEGIAKLLHTIDHFCEMVFSFASKFQFLDNTHSLLLRWYNEVRRSDNVIRDDPTDLDMIENVMPYIRDNTINCSQILLVCMWDGEEDNCGNLFVPVLTDIGVGCSFNRIPEKILRNSTGLMSLLYNKTTASDEENSAWKEWDMDVALREAVDKFTSPRKFPRTQNAAGIMKGISFLLLHDVVQNFTCPATSSSGFLVAVHSPFEEPQMLKNGIGTPALHEVFIKVKGELRIVDRGLINMPVDDRKCYFQTESKLKIFKKYTLANCQSECRARTIAANCHCQQLLMSTGNNETLCGPSQIECVRNVTRELDRDGYNKMCGEWKCLPPCSDVKYETSVSYLPYHEKSIFDFYGSPNSKLNSLGPQSITSIVHVYQETTSLFVRRLTVLLLYTFVIGTIFGILGWTLEFTVESIFKIVDGLNLLLYELYQRTLALLYPTIENQNDHSHPPIVLNNLAAVHSNGGRENFRNRDNDYDSSSDDEGPEDNSFPSEANTGQGGAGEPTDSGTSLVDERSIRSLQNDLKKTKERITIVKNEIESQMQEKLERIAVDFRATNEALIKTLMDRIEENMKEIVILKNELKFQLHANTATVSANTNGSEIKYDEKPHNDEIKKGETISSPPDQVELTNVQTIDETRPECSRRRFTRGSNLVVLFRRSVKPSNPNPSDHHESNHSSLPLPEVSIDLEMPEEEQERSESEPLSDAQAHTALPSLVQMSSLSSQLLDIDDESYDNLKDN